MPQIKIKDTKTDEWKTITISEKQFKSLHDLHQSETTHDKLLLGIENLNVDNKTKSFLESVLNSTIDVGGTIINIGKKIIEVILYIVKKFPHGAIGAILGYLLGHIIASIPILGWVLKWVVVPLATITGAALGAKMDLSDKNLASEIKEKVFKTFSGIKDIKA